eukprot:TRINITY_DN152_c2_g1_i1.p1 TRINITY_DN152_c2_g1~~TRINITY_DN152_c2_g1_i1.p1  ORF type:complete len:519 (+),score=184.29 TRINITY_DN152_c2_g1_i1:109-1665(+)
MNRIPIPLTIDSFSKKKKEREGKKNEKELENLINLEEDNLSDDELNDEFLNLNEYDNDDNYNNDDNDDDKKSIKDDEDDEDDEDDLTIDEHASVIMAILKPVALTMMIVISCVYFLDFKDDHSSIQVVWMVYQETDTDSTVIKFTGALINAALFVVMIVVVTIILVLLYKYRCMKIIFGWLILCCATLLGFFGAGLFIVIVYLSQIPMDWITLGILVWNFTFVGMISLFWYTPKLITKLYLIIISALLALFFTRLPEWTTWTILVAVAIYDLFSVLCPKGPLKVLVNLAQERDEPVPAILYSAMAYTENFGSAFDENSDEIEEDEIEEDEEGYDNQINEEEEYNFEYSQNRVDINLSDDDDDDDFIDSLVNDDISEHNDYEEDDEIDENVKTSLLGDEKSQELTEFPKIVDDELENDDDDEEIEEHEERGSSIKLGLGDFVFYSVLVGKAAEYDIITVITCFIAIITGLYLTLVLLAIFRRPLPALPISIMLGTIFYVLTKFILVPFILTLSSECVFI